MTDELFPDDEPVRELNYTPFEDMSAEQRDQLTQRWQKPTRKRSGKAKTPENNARTKIEAHLKQIGVLYRRTNAGFWKDDQGNIIQGMPAGTSDYLACISIDMYGVIIGVFAAIEIKALGRERAVTELQEKFLAAVAKRGGIRIVASTVLHVDAAIEQYRLELSAKLSRAFQEIAT